MHVLFSLPPEVRQPGRIILRLSARVPSGASHERAIVFEIADTVPEGTPPATGDRPPPAGTLTRERQR
jgi:hypothetical protein